MTPNILMNKIILITLLLTGCSHLADRDGIGKKAQSELIGMSSSEIIECAGVPLSRFKYDDIEQLTYTNLDDFYLSDFMAAPGSGLLDRASALDHCEITLTLKNDRVESVVYSTNHTDLLASDDQCAYIFKDCLPVKQ